MAFRNLRDKGVNVVSRMPSSMISKAITGIAGLAGVIFLGSESFYTVQGGHRAVVFSRFGGVKPIVYGEGLQFKVPFVHYPTFYSIRAKPRNIQAMTGSKDLQMVELNLRLLAKPDANRLVKIHQMLGPEYDEKILPSIANEVMKTVVAQFNASELVTQRESVSTLINQRLSERAREFFIQLEDVAITHLRFSPEYEAAIEAKQVALQEAERAKFIVEKAVQEKRAAVIKAQGDAKAARMVNDQILNSPYFLELRKIEAAKAIANTISKSSNRVYLNSDNLLFNLLAAVGSVGAAPSKGAAAATAGPGASSSVNFDALLAASEKSISADMNEADAVLERTLKRQQQSTAAAGRGK